MPRRLPPLPLVALALTAATALAAPATYREAWRPQFHFTPPANWMNDPNGLVYADGEYHLFYQHNPAGDRWGHMSWGHAASRDLVHWEHRPLALAEENSVMVFSGCAVVDWRNTAGFGTDGTPPLVAVYTGHATDRPRQSQHLAFSRDHGRTWTKYEGNPVLDLGLKDFRDPKVFWHDPVQQWVMAVALPEDRRIQFYRSADLKRWTLTGEFGPAGATGGQWECPDLFPLPVEGGGLQWVLAVNLNPGGRNGGSACQYFVGDFDGATFRAAEPAGGAVRWADWGRDFYAASSWNDVPARDGRRLWIGWMNNWEYAQEVPTAPWRGALSLPRELSLRPTPDGLRLVQAPVRELAQLRGRHERLAGATLADANRWLAQRPPLAELLELDIEFEGVVPTADFGLRLATGLSGVTTLRCDAAEGRMTLDRTQSGRSDFHPRFAGIEEGPVRTEGGRLRVRLFLDALSLEVFAAEGETVFTELIFPAAGARRLELFAAPRTEAPRIRRLDLWELRSAWAGPVAR